jgi:Leucine-rich repeat (LRR) protein
MVLELSGNQITRVEDSIGNMVMLKELDLSGNMLSHLSDALGMLPKLEVGTWTEDNSWGSLSRGC